VVLAPEPVSVGQVFRHPFLVEDMTSLLAAARAAPILLRRGDEKPFARFVEEAAAMLLTLPDWLEAITGLSLESRIGLALQALRLTDLLDSSGAETGGAAALTPGAGADAWLRCTVEERRDIVVSRLRVGEGRPTRLFDLLEEHWASREEAQVELLPWLEQAFAFVPVTTFIRFSDFAEYQAAIGSPLAAASLAGPGSSAEGGSMALSSEEAMEELWKSFLGIFLGRCLLSLGGVEAGLSSDGKPGFRMTDVGRRLLGIPRDGLTRAEETSTQSEDPLVVQPNYEIVFLSPSPGVEAELGRFCDRIGRQVGVLFRISRQSVRKAGASGFDAEQVIALLARRSRSPLPSNVVHEIRGWMAPAQRF
jgi:hypothetical protein